MYRITIVIGDGQTITTFVGWDCEGWLQNPIITHVSNFSFIQRQGERMGSRSMKSLQSQISSPSWPANKTTRASSKLSPEKEISEELFGTLTHRTLHKYRKRMRSPMPRLRMTDP